MADDRRRSPLAHRVAIAAPDGAVSIAERPHLGRLILRAEAAIAAAVVKQITGAELPIAPNRTSRSDAALVLWLGPDEWMVVTDPGAEGAVFAALAGALSGRRHQLVDVTDQHTTIALAGWRAREMLMKLTTLDLHASRFGPGDCAGSMFGRVTATLCMTGAAKARGEVFELIVRRSFADYLWCLTAEAGREFGLPEQRPEGGETLRP